MNTSSQGIMGRHKSTHSFSKLNSNTNLMNESTVLNRNKVI